jgi:hypothetical protein
LTILATVTDGKTLTEGQICQLGGISHQRRKTWVDRRLLRDSPSEGCQRSDARGLAQLRLLFDVLGPTDGAAAWQQVGAEVEADETGGVLDILFDIELKQAKLVRKRNLVGELVAHGRPVRLVALAGRRAEIDAAFDRLCAAIETRPDRGTEATAG